MSTVKTTAKTIQIYRMISPGDSVVIGLSGGADSVALLHLLRALQDEMGIRQIFAAHINHGLRETAINDENFVIDLCNKRNLPIKVYHAKVADFAKKESLTIEEAGRKLRYLHMKEACTFFCTPDAKIATGHHQNDNAETVIMNLARGTGLRGLCGIPPVNGQIIRPLLDISRKEIEEYLHINGFSYVTDASNFSHDYTRNRIRHSVLPAMENAVNPQTVQTIAKNTAWLREEDSYLESLATEAFLECKESGCDHVSNPTCHMYVALNVQKLISLPLAISRRVIRIALHKCNNGSANQADYTSIHIQSLLNLAAMKSGKEIHLPGLIAYKEYSQIIIAPHAVQVKPMSYPLLIPSKTYIPELNITITLSQTPPEEFENSTGPILIPVEFNNLKNHNLLCTKSFDYGKVDKTLILRTRMPGDKIIFSTTKSTTFTKKLQDYFTDTKTPKHVRDTIPLLACGSEVLWVMDEKGPVSAKYSSKNQNPFWVSLWRDADD